YSGGGSGGSVWLTCTTLAGGGNISADGGAGGSGCCAGTGGGGGGGRVGVYYTNSTFFGNMNALGGPGSVRGGAGTVYAKRAADARGTFTVDNNNNAGETTEFYGPTLVDANMVVRRGGRVGAAHRQTDFDLTVVGNLLLDAPLGGAPGGAVYADGRGFAGSQGPGRGGAADGSSGGGAGYGGAGGRGGPGGAGGITYGSSSFPVELGSGGGNRYSGGVPEVGTGGSGGGHLRLSVLGTLDLRGEISARGAGGAAYAGGGSGGSILLSYGSVVGTGVVTANGGNGGAGCCATTGGGGGGGRIAIYRCSTASPTMQVLGGTGNAPGLLGTTFVGSAAFLTQPDSLSVCPSGTKVFQADALGTGPFTYRWQWQPVVNGAWINVADGVNTVPGVGSPAFTANGALTAAMSIPAASSNRIVYPFRCLATNGCASLTSGEGELVVCTADFDCSGGVDSDDTIAFFDTWDVSNALADVNRDGGVDGDDIIAFFARWDAGC
ncbi:MAG: GC-type dockerin domain-anchored protein, partial [Phycisphaerales bacterium]